MAFVGLIPNILLGVFVVCSRSFAAPTTGGSGGGQQPPNIIFILADDLGWDDVGFHGSEIKTPNIDRLAKEGIILNNYYVQPICTPTRSAILTGRYPIHTGLQFSVPLGSMPYGMPLNLRTLPEVLKTFNYDTHAIGKWHLGFCSEDYIPENRGFDTFLGFYQANGDYFDHHARFRDQLGYDFRFKKQVAWNYSEVYSTDIFTDRAKSIIASHDKSKPLFIYFPQQGVHAAEYDVIQAPQRNVNRFPYIINLPRKYFAGSVSAVDDSVGAVYQALVDAEMADNTIIVFSTDNGGPTNGRENMAASNWPLRGSKNTHWQGGVHGVGFIHSPLLKKKGYVSEHLIHATDWFPTFISIAARHNSSQGFDLEKELEGIDGFDQWDVLSMNVSTNRKEVLVNIDPVSQNEAIIVSDFKLLNGEMLGGKFDGWYPPPPHDTPTATSQGHGHKQREAIKMAVGDPSTIHRSNTELNELIDWMNKRYDELGLDLPSERNSDNYASLKVNSESDLSGIVKVNCGPKPANASTNCNLRIQSCLFNLRKDPCEYMNLYNLLPDVANILQDRLDFYRSGMVPPINKPLDPKGDPKFHGGVWGPWL